MLESKKEKGQDMGITMVLGMELEKEMEGSHGAYHLDKKIKQHP